MITYHAFLITLLGDVIFVILCRKWGCWKLNMGFFRSAETLDFLHNNAVFRTSTGAWKLGGFGFATSVDQVSTGSTSMQPFNYPEYDVEDAILPLQPSLNYTAPELYMNRLTYLSSEAFSMIPSELVGDLQRMSSLDEASRPSALDITDTASLFQCHIQVYMLVDMLHGYEYRYWTRHGRFVKG
ncbi:uncharacterized protein LOC109840698 isoform X6 [Asparagus officinalis]|uniref:uncharacterized protein LOC109840698 isoform X6 n=1 Tax=Asparagus officinalis TaxID=4686 RepID=UPI00098E173D|nr:uncharacterized protein LOC109840698 isoform X6 [Asparagus officinalis]